MKERHMNQNIVMILGQGWTNLLSKGILSNHTKLQFIIRMQDFNRQMENNTRTSKLKTLNLLTEPTSN